MTRGNTLTTWVGASTRCERWPARMTGLPTRPGCCGHCLNTGIPARARTLLSRPACPAPPVSVHPPHLRPQPRSPQMGCGGLALKTNIAAVELAQVCMDASNDVAGGFTAGLGPHAILRSSPGQALHLDFAASPPAATACPLTFHEYGLGLLVVDTHVPHPDEAAVIRQRMAETHQAVAALDVASIGAMQGDVPFARVPRGRLRRQQRRP